MKDVVVKVSTIKSLIHFLETTIRTEDQHRILIAFIKGIIRKSKEEEKK